MKDSVSLVLCGEAGQGIKTVEALLTKILKLDGYNVFATKEYMSRVRGGVNTTSIRVSSIPVSAYNSEIDLLIPLHHGRTSHLEARINQETVVLGEHEHIDEQCHEGECHIFEVPYTDIAASVGNKIYSNVVAVGVVCGLFQVEQTIIADYIKKQFNSKGDKIIKENILAAQKGYGVGQGLLAEKKVNIEVKKDKKVKTQMIVNGAEAVALGALAGGCNFISAYPMSPSTGVFVFLAQHARDFGLVAEQAEDEISAMNMALGAWYAGARALVSTSGGGFALMTEGLSLAGMIETPVVIHLAQRPGPATGLPTRTEQGDLNFALHAGHGEFPRLIFAPGNIEEAFYLTQKAFNLADKYQIPVFILTDQYLMDSYYNLEPFDFKNLMIEQHLVKTKEDYQRYFFTENGISPRGTPGYGQGLVAVDSDEHDQAGHITEDLYLRSEIVDKRLKKLELLEKEALEPELIGPKDYKILVIGWGTTAQMIKEALGKINRKDIALLHFQQVYPLPSNVIKYLVQAEKVVAIENNATSQFADLIKLQAGFEVKDRIHKFDGLPFSVGEIVASLNDVLGG